MPYINLITNKKIEDKKKVHDLLGECITLIPGKSLSRTMTHIEEEKMICFAGTDEPCAYVETMVNAGTNHSNNEAYGDAVIEMVAKELEIPKDRIYVNVDEKKDWFSK